MTYNSIRNNFRREYLEMLKIVHVHKRKIHLILISLAQFFTYKIKSMLPMKKINK